MADVLTPSKALAVNPLKASQPIGASLAFLGLADAMPLEHGARGCAAFNKLFFMRHFHEPIALQTTAMDQTTTVLGSDLSVVEALATICEKNRPQVIGLITTGLSEMQGADVPRTITAFRRDYPQYDGVAVVPVSASDTFGCLETGYARAVEAIIEALAPRFSRKARETSARQVNVLASAMLTPGDVDALKQWIGAFGLSPVVIPDLSDSLDGHLIDAGFSTLTYGGTTRAQLQAVTQSAATLAIGPSMRRAAELLRDKTGAPVFAFDGLMTLDECDAFSETLAQIAGVNIPERVLRARARLEDAMVDCQFQFGGAKVAIAADPDHLAGLARFFAGMGAEIVAAVSSTRAEHLERLPVESVVIGDLEDLEWLARVKSADLIVTNSHGAEIAQRVGAALMRAGFPIYDSYGAHAKAWVGYDGARQTVFETANLLAAHYQEIRPYRSIYWKGGPRDAEEKGNASC